MDFDAYLTDRKKFAALFDPSLKYQLIESYGRECYTETDDGQLLFEIYFTDADFLKRWILSFGSGVKVLEPDYIAEGIRAEAEKILKKYK